jgi:hypothetical protein
MASDDEVAVVAPSRAVCDHVKELLLRIAPATGRIVLSGATYRVLPSHREGDRVEWDRGVHHPSFINDP